MAHPRTVFMGSSAEVIPVLEALLRLQWPVAAVYTPPDRRVGRGLRWAAPPVKEYAQRMGLPVCQPASLRSEEAVRELAAYAPDLVLVAAYGKLLPPPVLEVPRRGCLNVHPSLLPRHRGASPVAAAILDGDAVTGVSLMEVDEGLDTGPVLAQREEPVRPDDSTPALIERLFGLGAELVEETLPRYVAGEVTPSPQSEEGATVSRRVKKEDGELDWSRPALRLERQVRAYLPWPGSATRWEGKRFEVLEARVVVGPRQEAPGTVVGLPSSTAPAGVVTGDGMLVLRRVKLEGRPELGMAEFLRGNASFLDAGLPS